MYIYLQCKKIQIVDGLNSKKYLIMKTIGGPEKGPLFCCIRWANILTSESVESTSLSLESVDDIHGSDGLPLGVLGVGDGISDNVLQEHLQNSTGLLIDESGNTLDSTTSCQPSDCGLGDTLDVVSQNFPVTLGASLSKSFASFSTSSHVEFAMTNDSECGTDREFIADPGQS